MDRVVEYLAANPGGATSQDIAREAMGLTGALGAVAEKVVRAAADADDRIAEATGGLWVLSKGPKKKTLREMAFATVALKSRDDGTLHVGLRKTAFNTEGEYLELKVPAARSERAARTLGQLESFVKDVTPIGFRLATLRGAINASARLQLGRTLLRDGVCISRLARRCYPASKIRTCGDIAASLGLSHVDNQNLEAITLSQSELLLGLLENCESRSLNTLEDVLEDLKPNVTAVDFETFVFDEAYLDELPELPGVYVMRDIDGQVVYVGKSVHLRDRVRTYFAKRSERAEKTLKILERIWTVEVEVVGSELEALILEARMIQATKPEFNKQVEVGERDQFGQRTGYFVIVLPSASADCVELFCVRQDREICRVSTRKDLVDWEACWAEVSAHFDGKAEALDETEEAGHRILQSWIQQKQEDVNLIDVDDAGERSNLKRLLETHIRESDNDDWEKVWRV